MIPLLQTPPLNLFLISTKEIPGYKGGLKNYNIRLPLPVLLTVALPVLLIVALPLVLIVALPLVLTVGVKKRKYNRVAVVKKAQRNRKTVSQITNNRTSCRIIKIKRKS